MSQDKRQEFIRRLMEIDEKAEALTIERARLFDEINAAGLGFKHQHILLAAHYLRAEKRVMEGE